MRHKGSNVNQSSSRQSVADPRDHSVEEDFRVGWEGDSPSTSRKCRIRHGMTTKRLVDRTGEDGIGNAFKRQFVCQSENASSDKKSLSLSSVKSPLMSKVKIRTSRSVSNGIGQPNGTSLQHSGDPAYNNPQASKLRASTTMTNPSSALNIAGSIVPNVTGQRTMSTARPTGPSLIDGKPAVNIGAEEDQEKSERKRLEIIAHLNAVLGDSPGTPTTRTYSRVSRSNESGGVTGNAGRGCGIVFDDKREVKTCITTPMVVAGGKSSAMNVNADESTDSDSTFDDSFILATQAMEEAQAKSLKPTTAKDVKKPMRSNDTQAGVTTTVSKPSTSSQCIVPKSALIFSQMYADNCRGAFNANGRLNSAGIAPKIQEFMPPVSSLAIKGTADKSPRVTCTSTPITRQQQRSRNASTSSFHMPIPLDRGIASGLKSSSCKNREPKSNVTDRTGELILLEPGFKNNAETLHKPNKRLKTDKVSTQSPDLFSVAGRCEQSQTAIKMGSQKSRSHNTSRVFDRELLNDEKLSPIVAGSCLVTSRMKRRPPDSPVTSPKTPISRFRDRLSGNRSPLSTSFGSNSSTEDLLADMDIPE